MRKLRNIALICAAAIIGLIVVAIIFFSTSPGEGLVKGWIEEFLGKETGLSVRIEKFETNLWSRVHIDGLSVNTVSDTTSPLIYIARIHTEYSLNDFLTGDIALELVAVDSIELAVAIDSLGNLGIPMLDAPADTAAVEQEASDFAISVDSISVTGVNAVLSDKRIPITVYLNTGDFIARQIDDNEYEGRLTVSDIFCVYDSLRLTLKSIAVDGGFADESVSIAKASANAEGLGVEFTGSVGIGDTQNISGELVLDGSVDSILTRIQRYYALPEVSVGDVFANVQIEGQLAEPGVSADVTVRDAIVSDISIPTTRIQASYSGDVVTLDSLTIAMMDGLISCGGLIAIDSTAESSVDVDISAVSLASIWRVAYKEASPYTGLIDGHIRASGRTNDLLSITALANLTGRDLTYNRRNIPRLDLLLTHDSGTTDFSLIHGADTIAANIAFSSDSLRGTFEIVVPNVAALARFADQPDLSGKIEAHGRINGAYENPHIMGEVSGRDIAYRNFPVDSLSGRIELLDSLLRVDDFYFAGAIDSIESRPPLFDIDSLGGSLSYRGSVKGSLDALTGAFDATMIHPRYGSFGIDSVAMKATIDKSIIEVSELRADYRGIAARLQARFDTTTAEGSYEFGLSPLPEFFSAQGDSAKDAIGTEEDFGIAEGEFKLTSDTTLTASMHGSGFWLGLLPGLIQDSTITNGTIDFDIAINGAFLAPTIVLESTIRDMVASQYTIDSIVTSAALGRGGLMIDSLHAYARRQSLKATGQVGLAVSPEGAYTLPDDAPVEARLESSGFDLSAFEDVLMPTGELSGTLATLLRVSGTIDNPHVDGWLNIEHGRIQIKDSLSSLNGMNLFTTFADSIVTIDSAFGSISDMPISLTGSVVKSAFSSVAFDLNMQVGTLGTMRASGALADTTIRLTVQSDSLNLAMFEPFVPMVDSLRGRLGCDVAINGFIAAPEITGSLSIQSLSVRADEYHARISDGAARIRFDRNKVYIDTASAGVNDGKVSLSGMVAHENGVPVDVNLQLQAIQVLMSEPDVYTAMLDSAVMRYGKEKENYVLDGDIVLGEVRVIMGLRPTMVLPWVQSLETVEAEYPDLIARSRLNVRIRESNKIWIDNNLANLRLRAEIGVIGTPLRPNFTGMVRVEEGYLLYLDRRFDVRQGTVFFNDPARFNPDILLDADSKVTVYRRMESKQYTVYIKAEGLLDNLQYGLFSDPPLDKPDIVALLTLGATRTELAGSSNGDGSTSNGITDIIKERAAAITSSQIAGFMSRKAGTMFGFDEFTIQGNLFEFSENWGPQLVASKQVTERVHLTYSTTVGHLNDQSIRLGYKLTPHFVLQGETDRQGRSGLDIKYGITFK
ncbi:MAG: translocation/assembly module TamB domain-containing protein [Candidatus Zixiibacteriota bacterium]